MSSTFTRRSLVTGALAGGALVSLDACGYNTASTPRTVGSSAPAAAGGKELARIVLATKMSELTDLNPLSARSSRALALLNHVSEGLTKFNPDFSVGPGLATKWTVSPDGLTYTFELRQGVKWHDGSAVTGDDVKFSFDAAMAADSKASSKATLGTYVSSVAINGTNAVLTLKKAYAPLLSVLAGQVPILPKTILGSNPALASFGTQPVGTGPYKIAKRDLSTLTIERNADYWGAKPKIATIVMFDSTDPAAQYAGMLTGQIDVVEYDANAMGDIASKGGRLWVGAAGSVHGICLDLQNPALSDVKVRQALRLGLDRPRIKAADYPTGTAAEALISTAFGKFTTTLPTINRDVAAANKLLDEAGWVKGADSIRAKNGTPFKIIHHTWPAKQWQDVATVAQANWKELGIDVQLTTIENARIADVLSAKFDAAPLGWGLTANPLVGLDLLLHTTTSTFKQGGTFNVFHYTNPNVDKLLDEVLATSDDAKQVDLAKQIQQIAYDDVPFIPIAYPAYQLGAKTTVALDETGKGGLSGVGQGWFMDRWSGA